MQGFIRTPASGVQSGTSTSQPTCSRQLASFGKRGRRLRSAPKPHAKGDFVTRANAAKEETTTPDSSTSLPRASEHARNTPFQTEPVTEVLSTDTQDSEEATSQWSSTATDLLAGLTGSLSMVPEALAFSVVAGVSPITGLQTAAVLSIMASLCGAQPGSVSGAAGATAVVCGGLTATMGPEYLYAAVIIAGFFQIGASIARLGKFIRLVPQPVMLGFINGLALVVAHSQLENFETEMHSWLPQPELITMCTLTTITMAIIFTWERVGRAVPAPLVAVCIITGIVSIGGIDTRTVGDLAEISGSLPTFHLPQVPLTFATAQAIVPVAVSLASVGLIQTLLTQQLVDELIDTRTSTHVEVRGQGIANVTCGFLGGMGGCAMVGQSLINVNAGGRTRVSSISCGVFLLLYMLFGADIIDKIPIAALTGVMLMLVLEIFDFTSIARLPKVPRTDAAVLILVTIVTYATNLAIAVAAGVVLSSLSFAWQSAVRGVSAVQVWDGDTLVFRMRGPLFFGSIQSFKDAMRVAMPAVPEGAKKAVVLDFMECRVWDSSALDVINSEAARFKKEGWGVHLRHLSKDCQHMLEKAGDTVDLQVMDDDPRYGLLEDYDSIVRSKGSVKRIGTLLHRSTDE